MNSLREELAKRLEQMMMANLAFRAGRQPGEPEPAPDFPHLMADECIRQMEWARREMKEEAYRAITQRRSSQSIFINIEDLLCTMRSVDLPLTLAPPDRKP